jgi:hypothetical protein
MNAKDAFHQTVHAAPGGCVSLAGRLGMSPTILRNKANPNNDVNVVTIDDIERVMEMTGDYRVLHALAESHGFVCTKLEDQPASDMAVLENVTHLWQRLGELAAEVHKTLEDGRVESHEVDACSGAAFKAIRPMLQLIDTLAGMAEKKPGSK